MVIGILRYPISNLPCYLFDHLQMKHKNVNQLRYYLRTGLLLYQFILSDYTLCIIII